VRVRFPKQTLIVKRFRIDPEQLDRDHGLFVPSPQYPMRSGEILVCEEFVQRESPEIGGDFDFFFGDRPAQIPPLKKSSYSIL
jgi:hypothetical protein